MMLSISFVTEDRTLVRKLDTCETSLLQECFWTLTASNWNILYCDSQFVKVSHCLVRKKLSSSYLLLKIFYSSSWFSADRIESVSEISSKLFSTLKHSSLFKFIRVNILFSCKKIRRISFLLQFQWQIQLDWRGKAEDFQFLITNQK